ncbi:BTAD domain-containing putative transcriptional regulator [Streptosporangium vulgare]|uniref:BTAD domain-containing putative transcriptional regulator n=1 Tax=Streptosporangium vulgare TaxID=46190 RepID=UPI003CD0687D
MDRAVPGGRLRCRRHGLDQSAPAPSSARRGPTAVAVPSEGPRQRGCPAPAWWPRAGSRVDRSGWSWTICGRRTARQGRDLPAGVRVQPAAAAGARRAAGALRRAPGQRASVTRCACRRSGGRLALRGSAGSRLRTCTADDRLCCQGLLAEALGLWRGPAFAEVADEPWAAGETARLGELRLAARELHRGGTACTRETSPRWCRGRAAHP